MSRTFYTYVWGSFDGRGSPLTFTSKANRTLAVRSTHEGDVVFGVVSRSPGDPAVIIPEDIKGRVVSAWQISHLTADTADFDVEARNDWDRLKDGSYRWPFALQPLRAWLLREPPEFREIKGYTKSTHTRLAVTSVQEVIGELARNLWELLVAHGEEVEVMKPRFHVMASQIQQLRQKHPFKLNAHEVTPNVDAINFIYIATLGRDGRTLKVGHAINAQERVEGFNKYRLSSEPQWVLFANQPIGSVQQAIAVEKRLGELFSHYRTDANNNEIYVGLDPHKVLLKLATIQL
jgi:hypothetical protein